MQVISHRGYWLNPSEKNSATAFARSFHLGYGTEFDVRDLGGELCVAHDCPNGESLLLATFFEIYTGIGGDLPLAINIKADGLQSLLLQQLERYGIKNCFVFDMSVPDSRAWLQTGVNVYSRQSDIESIPALYDESVGVWLDSFGQEWWEDDLVLRHRASGKSVAIVSSDLHGRNPEALWSRLNKAAFKEDDNVIICTDRPTEADEAING